ncbi:hypothetical protein NHX12_007087 [Muraenolepis orangiensis]|uniref:Uncharacterized protein n=1 Tax=Muraenolepis orangiensis TaxID=630683 RepID=A0A9Q0I9C6_9TELE|nr:hypothetical protein NHX12_007087 [Muraenolepis orangiensis]
MPKADTPPAYEDAILTPKYEDLRHLPQYSDPGHGVGPDPPPAPPPAYSPGPGSMAAGPGFLPVGMPHSIIPTLSAGVSTHSHGDMDEFVNDQWESTSVRHAFIRKVYLILAAQLSFTVGIVAVFTFVDPVRQFVIRNPAVYWASFGIYFIVYCVLICCKEPRRRFPLNLVLLGVFTLAMSYMTGTIASYYDTKAVFLAIGITTVVCLAVTIFCFQTKVDFTSCGGLLCILAVLLMIIGIITAVVLSFQYIPWLHMLYAAIGAVIYTLFLAYNTQLLIGNRELSLGPEEYIYGALSLYIDIVQIFLFILEIGGAALD